VSVALTGHDVSFCARPGLVVAVLGRLQSGGATSPGQGVWPGSWPGSSAEKVAQAWAAGGPSCLRGLAGDLVVAVVDRRSGQAHVVRDVSGAVPVHLLQLGGGLQATTSLPSLVASDVPLEPDEDWVGSYLGNRWPGAERSPYAGVAVLRPGSLAVGAPAPDGAAPGGGPGWQQSPHDAVDVVEDHAGGYDGSVERFRAAFDAAVRRRLDGLRGPLAVSLSGGLDSSSVLVTARAVAPEADLVAIGLEFREPPGDEREHQVAVARAARARLIWVDPGSSSAPFGAEPAEVLRRLGGPPVAGNWFLHEGLVRAAVAEGAQRVLDGEDGDGVLGAGQEYLADVAAHQGAGGLLREVAAVRALHGTSRAAMSAAAAREVVRAARARRWGRASVASSSGLVQGGYLGSVMGEAHAQWEALPAGISHPFLDREVLGSALGLPGHHRVRGGVTKAVLRSAMAERLPASVRARTDKAQLSGPFRSALLGPQWDVLQDGLARARRLAPDIREVPLLDRHEPLWNGRLYRAYRAAMVAHWRDWLTQRHVAPRKAP